MTKRDWKLLSAWWVTVYQGIYVIACIGDDASSSAWSYAKAASLAATVIVVAGANLYYMWKWAAK